MLKKISIAVVVGVVSAGLAGQVSASECVTAKGKITNNAQPDGSTLGVVALRLDDEKLRCGIVGLPQPVTSSYNFKHTIVCDDKASDDEAQAQITFNTRFASMPVFIGLCPDGSPAGPGSYAFSFEEISTPIPATARGAFQGATDEKNIVITGDFNCSGGINMKFEGEICFADE